MKHKEMIDIMLKNALAKAFEYSSRNYYPDVSKDATQNVLNVLQIQKAYKNGLLSDVEE